MAELPPQRRAGQSATASAAEAPADLVLESIEKGFGGVKALQGLSMRLPGAQVSAIIGPNGAGKTTLFNVITGYTRPDAGRVLFGGRDITRLKPYRIERLGIARTFQDLKLFEDLSCLDNLRVAATLNAEEAAAQLDLLPIAAEIAGNLPYASQKLTALGRALASRPKFLLLDEPTSGLDRETARRMLATVRRLAEMNIGVCLIEHNLDVVRELHPHVLCLHLGKLFAEGELEDLESRQDVRDIFFGSARPGAGPGDAASSRSQPGQGDATRESQPEPSRKGSGAEGT